MPFASIDSRYNQILPLHLQLLHPPAQHDQPAQATGRAGVVGKFEMIDTLGAQPPILVPPPPQPLQRHRIIQQMHPVALAGQSDRRTGIFPGAHGVLPAPGEQSQDYQ